MANASEKSIYIHRPTLAFWDVKSFAFQGLLVGLAVALPVVAHLTGAPVRILLPMHWPVILAGLVYGWRGGALVGLLAPSTSFVLSGMPVPPVIPAMTAELFCYGFISGLLREHFRLNPFASIAVALIAGRIAFISVILITGTVSEGYKGYFKAALLPGLPAALGQLVLLPLIASWWIKQARARMPKIG